MKVLDDEFERIEIPRQEGGECVTPLRELKERETEQCKLKSVLYFLLFCFEYHITRMYCIPFTHIAQIFASLRQMPDLV